MTQFTLHTGNSLDILKTMPDNSIDSVVTDPPYELGFMGKGWDKSGIANNVELWKEVLRVLKPGGHLIAFGGTRTYHRMTSAIEDAGFEIRDCIAWLYGSGFPKSLNVSKALDKLAGAEREVVGVHDPRSRYDGSHRTSDKKSEHQFDKGRPNFSMPITAPSTDDAKKWQGWGTALKPAHEPAVLARKPLIGTVADTILTWGTGALNIDGTRVPSDDGFEKAWDKPVSTNISNGSQAFSTGASAERGTHKVDISSNKPVGGRWPANIILDEEAAELLDEQSGVTKSTQRTGKRSGKEAGTFGKYTGQDEVSMGHSDSGGASRFFYTAKASKSEREAGLDGMQVQKVESDFRQGGMANPRDTGEYAYRVNHHPTVKPIELMRYLVRLVTPVGGVILDPFSGSGSTGCAAVSEGFYYIGVDLSQEYNDIAEARIKHWLDKNR
jgi:DNA modification methylase